jgi:predicted PurR-regulated permease PerM
MAGWGRAEMIIDEHALTILTLLISMLSLLTSIVTLSIILQIRPLTQRLVDAITGVQNVNQQLLNQLAIIADRTARPNE